MTFSRFVTEPLSPRGYDLTREKIRTKDAGKIKTPRLRGEVSLAFLLSNPRRRKRHACRSGLTAMKRLRAILLATTALARNSHHASGRTTMKRLCVPVEDSDADFVENRACRGSQHRVCRSR